MATAVPAKPLPPAQKLKRPPPPFVQTGVNGTKSSQTSPSPSTIKRPPGLKQPSSTNGSNGVMTNGTGPRTTNRQRKETQRPGEAYANRLNRLSTRNVGGDGGAFAGNRVAKKAMVESYVRTTAHILKKFSKSPPSFSLHLYPTNFKIEGQDGSFGYNSPMKTLLEHIKAQTIPHDMMEEFRNAGFRLYDESLIIRIVDHRSSASATSTSSTTSSTDDTDKLFSIHNWNEHLLPSPYAAFPLRPSSDTQPSQQLATDAEPSTTDASDGDVSAPAPAPASNDPKVFTTVLHPTPLSLLTDMTILATTPDPRALNRRQSQAFLARTPASATMPHPPTPLSAIPQAPVNERGPPTKKQKMMLEAKDFHDYEARVINAVAPPLYLEPLDSLPEAQELMKLMRSELHSRDPPSPKTRKRTVAELAADDARAAEEERFILIMDERLGSTASGAAAAGGGNDQAGAAFEPRFNRFKTLESLKIQQEEKTKRELEEKMQRDHLTRQQKEEDERAKRQQLLDARTRDAEMRQEARRQQLATQLNHTQQANGAPQVNGMVPNMPNMMHVSQGQHSSPVVRTQTPQRSSPAANAMIGTHPSQSVPMNVTSSNQGAGSPPRSGSALQHPHPGVAAMAHSMSQNRSQQGLSRNGTPQMPQGTPAMQHSTPVMRQVSVSTPRMSHGSPVGSTMAATPVMQAGMMATPNLTHQQMEAMRRQQAMQNAAQMNGVRQLSPQQIAHLQQQQQYIQHQAQQQQQHGLQHQQHGGFPQQQQMHPSQYQTALRAQMEAQMRTATNQQQQHFQQQQQPHSQVQMQQMHGSPPHPGMVPNPQQQQQVQMQNGAGGNINMSPQMQAQLRQRVLFFRQQMIQTAQAQSGPHLSDIMMTNINRQAQARAMQEMRNANARAQAVQQAAQQQAQRAQQMHMMGQQ